jgi:hypothetical protein
MAVVLIPKTSKGQANSTEKPKWDIATNISE